MGALPRPPHARDDEPEQFSIPLAPLVDIVFLLLVFFLLATTFMDEEKDLTLTLPRAEGATSEATRLERILINVRADGTVLVGDRPTSRNDLYQVLIAARRANPEIPVILRGDRSSSHGEIVEVLSICRRARVRNVAVAVQPLGAEGSGAEPAPGDQAEQ